MKSYRMAVANKLKFHTQVRIYKLHSSKQFAYKKNCQIIKIWKERTDLKWFSLRNRKTTTYIFRLKELMF